MLCPNCKKKWMKKWMMISKWREAKDHVQYLWVCECGHELLIKENK